DPKAVAAIVPRAFRRWTVEGLLRVALVAYTIVAVAGVPGTVLLGAWRYSYRRRGVSRPQLARWLLFGASCLCALVAVETSAAVFRAWMHRLPTLPTTFAQSSEPEDISIVVIGGSSALGEPFRSRVSVGQIVAWQLQEALPKIRFNLEVL